MGEVELGIGSAPALGQSGACLKKMSKDER